MSNDNFYFAGMYERCLNLQNLNKELYDKLQNLQRKYDKALDVIRWLSKNEKDTRKANKEVRRLLDYDLRDLSFPQMECDKKIWEANMRLFKSSFVPDKGRVKKGKK